MKAYTDDNLQLELPSKTMSIKNYFQKHVLVQLRGDSRVRALGVLSTP